MNMLQQIWTQVPTWDQFLAVLLLRDYNTRLVVFSTTLLGLAAGIIGTFLLLRKRSLMGDALSHATLPGIAGAFIVMVLAGGDGKWLPGLLTGAAVFGSLGVLAVVIIRSQTRLKDDAAMGIVLSVFFGIGVALLALVQQMPQGSAAGLETFIYGKTASMVWDDFLLIAGVAMATAVACGLLYKEMTLLCFDEGFAAAQGWPITRLDVAMLALVTAVTVIGLQAVGLILIIALLIIPPAAARFWTENLGRMILISALIGGISGWLGSSLSALLPRMPAGAVIVLVAATLFGISMLLGSTRGVLVRALAHWQLTRTVRRQHLLRAMYEAIEAQTDHAFPELARTLTTGSTGGSTKGSTAAAGRTPGTGEHDFEHVPISFKHLMGERSWSAHLLRRLLNDAQSRRLITRVGAARSAASSDHGKESYRLTWAGLTEATRIVRNHRLWELYLVTHADIAPSHVDRDADQIEHVLSPELVTRLEQTLAER